MINEQIDAVLCDVDGVLTDNRLQFSESGTEPAKTFYVLDGHGTVLLRKSGIFCAWITGRQDVAMQQRAAALKVDWHFAHAERGKGTIVTEILAAQKIDPRHTVFVGDDVTDIPAFELVGWPVAPGDAHRDIRRAARRVTRAAGGHGAFREVVDWVLRQRRRTA